MPQRQHSAEPGWLMSPWDRTLRSRLHLAAPPWRRPRSIPGDIRVPSEAAMDIPVFARGDDGPADNAAWRAESGEADPARPVGYAWTGWTAVQLDRLGRLLRDGGCD